MTTYTKVKFHLARLSNWLYGLATLFFLFSIVLLLFMLRDLIHHSFWFLGELGAAAFFGWWANSLGLLAPKEAALELQRVMILEATRQQLAEHVASHSPNTPIPMTPEELLKRAQEKS